jgi:hypothetical protein
MARKQLIEHEAAKYEVIAGLERALDRTYRHLLKTAQRRWESTFTGKDPSDACVSVRIEANHPQKRCLPGAGFLKAGKVTLRDRAKRALPHFAH